jgi:hypothetical protein
LLREINEIFIQMVLTLCYPSGNIVLEREVVKMNRFKKYCPNVWVAECEEEYEKGDIIQLETKYGKEVDCEVYNLVLQKGELFYYSIVRIEDKTYAERKAERYGNAAQNSINKSNERMNAAQEGREFLSLGEPIKVGHHSERRHRALIERNNNRMDKAMEYYDKAEEQRRKAEYWESKAKDITLAMPQSLEYFQFKLEKAIEYHTGLKNGTIEKSHSYSLTYANKDVKELKQKVEIAKLLWG